jgi:hypothetical protein
LEAFRDTCYWQLGTSVVPQSGVLCMLHAGLTIEILVIALKANLDLFASRPALRGFADRPLYFSFTANYELVVFCSYYKRCFCSVRTRFLHEDMKQPQASKYTKTKQSSPAERHGSAWGERRYSSFSFTTSALDGGEWSASRPGRMLLCLKCCHILRCYVMANKHTSATGWLK